MTDVETTPRRDHILRSAERLFRHYGFAKTTVADIARDAEVGVGTVYLEFASKQELAAALSRRRHDRILGAMRDAARSDAPWPDRFRAVFDARIAALVEIAKSGQHGMDLLRSKCEAATAVHEQFRSEETDLVIDLLCAGRAAGAFDVPEPLPAARALLHIYGGFTPALLCGTDSEDLRSAIDATHELVLHGLLDRGDSRRPK